MHTQANIQAHTQKSYTHTKMHLCMLIQYTLTKEDSSKLLEEYFQKNHSLSEFLAEYLSDRRGS